LTNKQKRNDDDGNDKANYDKTQKSIDGCVYNIANSINHLSTYHKRKQRIHRHQTALVSQV